VTQATQIELETCVFFGACAILLKMTLQPMPLKIQRAENTY
jgi:hypothetical protein